jgi:hypothetical protein
MIKGALSMANFKRLPRKNPLIICEQKRGSANFASFEQAENYVRSTGLEWKLEKLTADIYIVTRSGQIVGKGLHYNTAIDDAESNL